MARVSQRDVSASTCEITAAGSREEVRPSRLRELSRVRKGPERARDLVVAAPGLWRIDRRSPVPKLTQGLEQDINGVTLHYLKEFKGACIYLPVARPLHSLGAT